MTRREPSDEAIVAARLQRAYPSLSPYSSASLAQQLCAIERAQRTHTTRQCNGEYRRRKTPAELGYVKDAGTDPSFYMIQDEVAEERAGKRIVAALTRWKTDLSHRCIPDGIGAPDGDPRHEAMIRLASALSTGIELHGDPRGAVLKVRLPGEAEAVSV